MWARSGLFGLFLVDTQRCYGFLVAQIWQTGAEYPNANHSIWLCGLDEDMECGPEQSQNKMNCGPDVVQIWFIWVVFDETQQYHGVLVVQI